MSINGKKKFHKDDNFSSPRSLRSSSGSRFSAKFSNLDFGNDDINKIEPPVISPSPNKQQLISEIFSKGLELVDNYIESRKPARFISPDNSKRVTRIRSYAARCMQSPISSRHKIESLLEINTPR